MSRKCFVTGKGVMSGNNVSHSHKKTRRRFLPNLQVVSLMSKVLNRMISVRITTRGLRTIEHKKGIDEYLLKTSKDQLPTDLRKIKRKIMRKIGNKEQTGIKSKSALL